jgi:small subunit ribosomal protein S15
MAEEKTEMKKPDWVKMKPAELEKIVLELFSKGESPAKIGLILRDKHGIPKAKVLGKRITEILKEAKVPLKSEKAKIQAETERLNKHIEKNKHDATAKRHLTKMIWALAKIKE